MIWQINQGSTSNRSNIEQSLLWTTITTHLWCEIFSLVSSPSHSRRALTQARSEQRTFIRSSHKNNRLLFLQPSDHQLASDSILIMRTSSLLLSILVVSQVDTSRGFAFSSHQPTAAVSRMNSAAMQLVNNNDDANMETSSSSSSSRPSRREIFRGSLLAGAAAAMIFPFENAKAMDLFSGNKSRIGGLADKIRGILKNMVSVWGCACHTTCHAKGSFEIDYILASPHTLCVYV